MRIKDRSELAQIKALLVVQLCVSFGILGILAYATWDSMNLGAEEYQPSLYERNNTLASELSEKGDWEGLLAHALRWVSQEPRRENAYWYRAYALYKLERYDEAASAFEEAKRVAPGWAEHIDGYLDAVKDSLSSLP